MTTVTDGEDIAGVKASKSMEFTLLCKGKGFSLDLVILSNKLTFSFFFFIFSSSRKNVCCDFSICLSFFEVMTIIFFQ